MPLFSLSLSSLFLVSGFTLFLLLCKICIYGICDYAVWKYSCVSLELESGLDRILNLTLERRSGSVGLGICVGGDRDQRLKMKIKE